MDPSDIANAITAWQKHIGRKGGRVRSEAKRKAALKSSAKARAAKLAKRRGQL